MRKNCIALTLALTTLIAGCTGGNNKLEVDNTNPVSTQNRVVYQLDVEAFSQEGTLAAAQQQLDRLDTLGIDIVWMKPQCGTIDQLRRFVDAAHEHGMRVWLDWVPSQVTAEEDSMLMAAMNTAMKYWVTNADIDGYCCDFVGSPAITTQDWHDIIREVKECKENFEFMSQSDITNETNHHVDVCGFDYDYARDFQFMLASRFGNEQTQADSLRAICEQMVSHSTKVQNGRIVHLPNPMQYGDNRYNLTVLTFTFQGMPLISQGQEVGAPENTVAEGKVEWSQVDRKMQHTLRTLIALHHTQPALAADAPVTFMPTSNPQVLAYSRGPVLVVLNLGDNDAQANIVGIAAGQYDQWLDSETIADGPSLHEVTLSEDAPLSLRAKGYAVYVKDGE